MTRQPGTLLLMNFAATSAFGLPMSCSLRDIRTPKYMNSC